MIFAARNHQETAESHKLPFSDRRTKQRKGRWQ